MSRIGRATQVIAESLDRIWGYGALNWADDIAYDLHTAGLLTPPPRIIRARDELAVLDPDTVLVDVDDPLYEVRMSASEWMEDYAIDGEGIFPLAVLATGEYVRAARQALKEAE